MKALLETLIEACRKGGRTAGKMRTEAADLVKQLRADGVCDTNEEACELVEFYLSPEHARLLNGSVEGGEKGGEESGKMRTDAADLVKQLRADGMCDTNEEACELVEFYLSPEHARLLNGSVEGGEKSGKMARTRAYTNSKSNACLVLFHPQYKVVYVIGNKQTTRQIKSTMWDDTDIARNKFGVIELADDVDVGNFDAGLELQDKLNKALEGHGEDSVDDCISALRSHGVVGYTAPSTTQQPSLSDWRQQAMMMMMEEMQGKNKK
eukprot:scaffold6699_cov69-Skeletonema_dohrnii-CCMP3373.AAC.1